MGEKGEIAFKQSTQRASKSEQRGGPGRRSGGVHFQLHCSGETQPADQGVERIRVGEWSWGREMRGPVARGSSGGSGEGGRSRREGLLVSRRLGNELGLVSRRRGCSGGGGGGGGQRVCVRVD